MAHSMQRSDEALREGGCSSLKLRQPHSCLHWGEETVVWKHMHALHWPLPIYLQQARRGNYRNAQRQKKGQRRWASYKQRTAAQITQQHRPDESLDGPGQDNTPGDGNSQFQKNKLFKGARWGGWRGELRARSSQLHTDACICIYV